MEIGLSQYSGAEFLQFYAVLSAAALAAAIWLPNWLRPDGRDQNVQDEEELAYLAGGAPRHAEAVVAALMAKGALTAPGNDKLHATRRAEGEKGAARAAGGTRLVDVARGGQGAARRGPHSARPTR